MHKDVRKTLVEALEENWDNKDNIITSMIRYDLDYMIEYYPELILKYSDLVEHTINKTRGKRL